MERDFMDQPDPLPRLPKKNYAVFSMNDNEIFFAPQLWEGKAGELPLFLEVNVGYNPDDEDPFMYPYESQELLFLYKRGHQVRAMLHDSHGRTLSLPVASDIQFIAPQVGEQEMTLAQILETEDLPMKVKFANEELIEFEVDRQTTNHTFFGDLCLQGTYEEPFFWALAIDAHGIPKSIPIILPANLKEVCFSHIISVRGAGDPAAKLQEFKDKFLKFAEELNYDKDPFFQDLAIVDKARTIYKGQKIEPHIDQNTFVKIRYKKRPAPFAPEDAPSLPPRRPVPPLPSPTPAIKKSQRKKVTKVNRTDPDYCPVNYDGSEDEHQYEKIGDTRHSVKGGSELKKPTIIIQAGGKGGQGAQLTAPPTESVPLYDACRPAYSRSGKLIKPSETGAISNDTSQGLLSMESGPPPVLPPRPTAHKIETLSVEEVSDRLTQLKLEKYRKKFKKNLIDGVLLKKLTKRQLQEDFQMSPVEALRLTTFISTGHVPK